MPADKVDMVYLAMDNRVYGMTKGQPSPTTEPDWDSSIAPGGIGLQPLNPLAVAVAGGANFVTRGFAGYPRDLAALILEGLRWPGLAFIEVMSHCVTFRPETFGWRKIVHPAETCAVCDRAAATAAILADDGFDLGTLFRGERGDTDGSAPACAGSMADVERQFLVGA